MNCTFSGFVWAAAAKAELRFSSGLAAYWLR
jgi:hypothetical protein